LNSASPAIPVEPLSFFFDSGIIVRGLLSIWRATRHALYLDTASEMCLGNGETLWQTRTTTFIPVLCLPDKAPLDPGSPLVAKSGLLSTESRLGMHELYEITGAQEQEQLYRRMLAYSLRAHEQFLPGDPDPAPRDGSSACLLLLSSRGCCLARRNLSTARSCWKGLTA